MEWLWQGIISNWLSTVLIMTGGLLIAYLKKQSSSWLGPAIWGFGGSGLVAFTLLCFWGISAIPKNRPPDVTMSNVEENLRTWMDDFGLSTKKEDSPAAYFSLTTTLPNGDPITVSRLKSHERYIAIQAIITIADEHKKILSALPKDELDELEAQLSLELGRAKTTNIISHPLDRVVLLSRMPITPTMTEDEFMRQLDGLDSGIQLVRNTVQIKVLESARKVRAK
jgi:hypothetical protein